jgi:formylglycine-generating enzyme required for sulfatase activity
MKRVVSVFIVVIVASMVSGCILSKTPKTNDVSMDYGDHMTFSVTVFPPATYTWTLDGEPLSNTGSSYDYTAQAGDYILEVKAKHFLGTDVQTWNIQPPILPDPVTALLASLVTIPAGSFMMGSTDDENGWAQYTTPVHQVTLQSFDIGKYEVTQEQYQAVMGTNPSYFQGSSYPDSAGRPVEQVTYWEARQFCTALSALTGRTFTLPSEAQWEYACRAGTKTLYSFGNCDLLLGNYAWWYFNSGMQTHPVGTRLPNPWGLYDMHGNVLEWCLDSWHTNYVGAPTDGSAWEPDTGTDRILRGGTFIYYYPWPFRSAIRDCNHPDYGSSYGIGFRVLAVR